MPNLWDRPPIPKRGDSEAAITWSHVGLVMSRWEEFEFELSRLYSWFAGEFDAIERLHEYGKGSIFRERSNTLKRKAEQYFRANPCQIKEAKFDKLIISVTGYADRRNDVAHSILFQIDRITFFRGRIKPNLLRRDHFAVIPPLYSDKKHQGGLPAFAYTSVEMNRLGNRLKHLRHDAVNLRRGE
jgi:hypothetical protein